MSKQKHRSQKKLSKVLSILYWKRVCQRLILVLEELNYIKHDMGRKALKVCQTTRETIKNSNREKQKLNILIRKQQTDKVKELHNIKIT